MIVGVAIGAAVVALLAAKGRRPVDPQPANPDPGPLVPPPGGSPEGWVQLQDALGLKVRFGARSWTSPAVRELLLAAGQVAAARGARLYLGDVGPAERGAPFPPHKSHRWGRDLDLAYTLDAYPTPDDVPVDPRLVSVLDAIAPWIETVGVHETRAAPLQGRGFKVSVWPGHRNHLHLRLRPELVAEVQPTLALAGLAGLAGLNIAQLGVREDDIDAVYRPGLAEG